MDAMQTVLSVCEHALADMDCLAVSIGPGSFTGLRVGTAAWKGLAFALDLPLVAVPTLDAMSVLNTVPEGVVIPMIDARMDEVFAAAYRFHRGEREKLTSDRVCTVETVLAEGYAAEHPLLVFGDGAHRYAARIQALAPHACFAPPPCGVPRADAVAREGYALMRTGAETRAAMAAPRYLRASQAEQARAQRMAESSADAALHRASAHD